MIKYFNTLYYLFVALVISSCTTVEEKITLSNYSSLDSLFEVKNYVQDARIAQIYVQNFNESIRDLDTDKRKEIFIESMLSNVISVNKDILVQRKELDELENNFAENSLNKVQKEKLEKLFNSYRCDEGDFDCLRSKINIFPPSLILAQAIVESGWGTSRFAIEANSVFGEHFSNGAEGEFIQASESDIKLRSFPSIKESVESYCLNLNRHRAYKGLREKRNEMIENNNLDAIILCEELILYSELGREYVEVLQGIIQSNSLHKYDNFVLDEDGEVLKIYMN